MEDGVGSGMKEKLLEIRKLKNWRRYSKGELNRYLNYLE